MKWTEEHGKELLEYTLLTAQAIKENYISKDKIKKELLEPIENERKDVYKKFMKKSKDDYYGVEGSVLQELNWIVGSIEELLEE